MSYVELEIFSHKKYWKYVDRVVKEHKGGKKKNIQNTKRNNQVIAKNLALSNVKPYKNN